MPDGFPPALLNALAESYYATLARNTLLLQELERIVEAFEQAGIDVIVLKGAALAQTVYEDIGLRPMSDIDLLVRQGYLEQAVRIAQGMGYGEMIPEGQKAILAEEVDRHAVFAKDNIALELHWNIVGGKEDWRTPPLDWVWEQTKPIAVSGHSGRTLKLSVNILFLSAHQALQHGLATGRLLWMHDVYRLLFQRGPDMDWDGLITMARELRWGASLRVVLKTVQDWFDYPIPIPVLTRLGQFQSADERQVRLKRERILTPSEEAWNRLVNTRGRQKIRLFLAHLFPSPEQMRYRYNPRSRWLLPLCYPYRWVEKPLDLLKSYLQHRKAAK
ncbi:MAG: hypothetical protein D6681_10565 [Calditrichaeota bacterium]|nr:MAG: hypothetical protein D6681_10565 [Calditrichota bacterium]